MKKLLSEVDKDNTGQIDFEGYLMVVLNKMVERPSQEDIQKAFRLFDQGQKGRVDFNDLKRIASQIGENITDDEMHEMIAEADRSGTGLVGPEDFVHIVTSYAHHYDGDK